MCTKLEGEKEGWGRKEGGRGRERGEKEKDRGRKRREREKDMCTTSEKDGWRRKEGQRGRKRKEREKDRGRERTHTERDLSYFFCGISITLHDCVRGCLDNQHGFVRELCHTSQVVIGDILQSGTSRHTVKEVNTVSRGYGTLYMSSAD